jgi:hypothetical protein
MEINVNFLNVHDKNQTLHAKQVSTPMFKEERSEKD